VPQAIASIITNANGSGQSMGNSRAEGLSLPCCQELALRAVTARRFCDQHDMSLHTATGRSLPYEMVRMRCGWTPREARNSCTVCARRAPSAMLYSRVPRSSA
jgi:hypothetical protein